jgi:hypothetical protein
MIIDDLDVAWSKRPGSPFEADPPLDINANTILTGSITFELFEAHARKTQQVDQGRGGFEAVENLFCLTAKWFEGLDPCAIGKGFCPAVTIANDHANSYTTAPVTSNVTLKIFI